MIIFGWGKRTTKDYGETHPIECPNCGNKSYARLVNIKTWFTLFFIPVIPYESKYLLLCDVCNRGYQLRGDKIKKAKELSGQTQLFMNNHIEEQEYHQHIREAKLFEG